MTSGVENKQNLTMPAHGLCRIADTLGLLGRYDRCRSIKCRNFWFVDVHNYDRDTPGVRGKSCLRQPYLIIPGKHHRPVPVKPAAPRCTIGRITEDDITYISGIDHSLEVASNKSHFRTLQDCGTLY
jgi:hypothetical protein